MGLPIDIKRAIRKEKPIIVGGHTLHPVLVEEYEEFQVATRAIQFMQQSLPVALLSVPLMQAFFALDRQAAEKGEESTGLSYSLAVALCLSLRLREGRPINERVQGIKIVADKNDRTRVVALSYLHNGEEERHITPRDFAHMRPIIAEQNGLTLYSDEANPELVEAEMDLMEQNSLGLNVNFEDLITTTAVLECVDEKDIYQWSIRKLTRRRRARERIADYQICGIASANGTKWKGGNPAPNLFFDRKKEDSSALIAASTFLGGAAQEAIEKERRK